MEENSTLTCKINYEIENISNSNVASKVTDFTTFHVFQKKRTSTNEEENCRPFLILLQPSKRKSRRRGVKVGSFFSFIDCNVARESISGATFNIQCQFRYLYNL